MAKNRWENVRKRVVRLEQLLHGFNREWWLVDRQCLLDGIEREAYLAALNRVQRALADARQVLVTALCRGNRMGEEPR